MSAEAVRRPAPVLTLLKSEIMLAFVAFLALFLPAVILHESAHAWTARRAGLTVTRFSIGFGPALLRWWRKGTIYTIRLIPAGGYVVIPRMDPAARLREGWRLPPLSSRARVLIAGPLSNLILGFALFVIVALVWGDVWLGDGSQVHLEPVRASVGETVGTAARATGALAVEAVSVPARLATGQVPMSDLGGPIAVAELSADYWRLGLPAVLLFTAVFNVILGVMNLLPLPGLDGFHLLMCGLEKVRGRPFSDRLHLKFMYAGLTWITLLTIAVIVLDILRIL